MDTDIHQSKLLEIILLDSYFKGRRIRVNAEQLVNLSGTNASGKSSFLKLLRIFYGDSPNDVAKARGKIRKSFVDYYLPRQSSYIVFVYQNQTGIKQVACFCKDQSLNYLFIDKAFNLDDYTEHDLLGDGVRPIIPCSNIYRHFHLQNVKTKIITSPSAYRKVLLGTASLKDKDLSDARRTFSLARNGKNLSMINTVITAALERSTDFPKIKELLSSIMLGGGSNTLEFNMDVGMLVQWQTEYRALNAIDNINNKLLPTLSEHCASVNISSNRLCDFKRDTIILKEDFSNKVAVINRELDELESEAKRATNDFRINKKVLDDKIDNHASKLSKLDGDIAQIEEQKLQWEEEQIGLKESELSKKDDYQSRLGNATQERTLLMDKVQNIEGEFARLREKRIAVHAKALAKQNQLLSGKKDELHQLEMTQATALSKLKSDFKLTLNDTTHDHKSCQKDLENQIQLLQGQLLNITAPAQMSGKLTESTTKLQNTIQDINTLVQNTNTLDKEENTLSKQHENLVKEFSLTNDSIQDTNKEKLKLNAMLKPAKHSVHEFLVENVEGWQRNIGRVLSEQVLQAKNLNPTYGLDDNAPSIFGLNINVELLDDKYSQSESEIHAKIEQCDIKIAQLEEQKETITTKVKEVNKALTSIVQDKAQLKAQFTDLKEQELECQNAIDTLKIQITSAIEKITTSINEQLSITKISLEKLHRDQTHELEQLNKQHFDSLSSMQSRFSADNVQLEEYIEQCKASILEINESHEMAFKRLAHDEKTRLSDEGIDTVKQEALDLEISTLESKLKDIKEIPDLLNRYNAFIKKVYSQLPTLQAERDNHQSEVNSHTKSLNQLKSTFAQDVRLREASLDKKSSQKVDLDKQLTQLDSIFSALFDYESSMGTLVYDFEEINDKYRSLLKRFNTSKIKVKQIVEEYINAANPHFKSSIKKSLDEQLMQNENDPHYLALGKFITIDFQDDINDTKNVVIETASLRGDLLTGFYDQLHRYEAEITKFSTRINHYLESRTAFTALGKVSVELKPLLSANAMFNSLRKFKKIHSKWMVDSQELPGAEYGLAMAEVLDNFSNNKISERHSNLYNLVFEAEVNGVKHTAKTGSELKEISSHGMSYLILLSFTSSLGCMIKGGQPISLCYGVDELGDISIENVSALFEMFKNDGDVLITALPNSDNNFKSLYNKRYIINREKNRFEHISGDSDKLQSLLDSKNHHQEVHNV